MKFLNNTLNFLNRQLVRIQWGYIKLAALVGIINSVSLVVTALSVSGLVTFTWAVLLILLVCVIVTILLGIYAFVKLGVLQNETRQTFEERISETWKLQAEYSAVLVATYLNDPTGLEQKKAELEKNLFKQEVKKNESTL